ncbi:retrovirus-related Pol polyprotein from transposon RE1 isoform X1 [Humulus lupulus]|uniref:retrovirus-related Pol polyprotein from transposon RE1 isoform X1 n=1 Tax=Humulus lupulus TaxID=3486 RepID=UPI002B408D8D|nr:retrovirus-related Pol polyprotein from transposon RE1 isoform X1 [Humulus lupulus]
MFGTHVPKFFWGDAILTAAYLINRMPSKVLKFQTPCQTLLQLFPHTRFISFVDPKIFGCIVFVHIYSQHRSKLDPKSIKCIFIGYSSHQKGYKCYSPTTRKTYNSMDVTFFEKHAYYKSEIQGENVNESHLWESIPGTHTDIIPGTHTRTPPLDHTHTHTPPLDQFSNPVTDTSSTSSVMENQGPSNSSQVIENQDPLMTIESQQQEPKEIRVYQRRKYSDKELKDQTHLECRHELELDPHPPEIHSGLSNPSRDNVIHINDDLPIALRKGVRACTQHPIGNFVSYKILSPSYQAFVSTLDSVQIPRTIQEALTDPSWKKAIQDEVNALVKNGTWEITKLPTGKKPVGCKWVFTIKHKADGSIERLKARLVAKGFTQSYGIDYQETFAPVAKLNTIRVLLSLAANQDWPLHQLDVKNAFLNGDLEEEVYMDIPPGFENSSNHDKVCRLKKSLYGLKQSPRAWFGKFTKSIIQNGYTQCQADHTLFVKLDSDKRIAILIVYVDDIILTSDYKEELVMLKSFLSKEFEIKDLGYLRYFLGMEIARSRHGIFVSQRKYVLDLLKETGMLGCKPASTPMESNKKIGSGTD